MNEPKRKKRIRWSYVIIAVLTVCVAIACIFDMPFTKIIKAIQNGEPLRGRALMDLEDSLEAHETEINVPKSQWDTDICPWSDAEFYLLDYIQATPEFYNIEIRNTSIRSYSNPDIDNYILSVAYFDELNGPAVREQVENAADSILETIPADVSEWEKARLIHDALIRHVTYAESEYDQTIYGALVEGKCVCMGYAMAYEYLLNRIGIECDTVAGYSDKVSAAMDNGYIDPNRHAWNIVTFEDGGEKKSYYVDTCWDDLGLKDANGEDYISDFWFCVTQEDIDKEGRSVLDEGYDMSRWNLNDPSMNYYVKSGYVIDHYDINQVIQIFREQLQQGKNLLSVRMADQQTYVYFSSAIENEGDFQRICMELGLEPGQCACQYSHNAAIGGMACYSIFLNYVEPAA